MTNVLAFLYAKPGKQDRLRAELLKVVAETLKEPGCLKFEAYQSGDHPEKFVVSEGWKTREDVDKHIALPHVQHLMGLADELFEKPVDVTFWNRI